MANDRSRLKRSEEQLREVVRMLCHLVWNGKPAAGEHVWSIPADNELAALDAERKKNAKLLAALVQIKEDAQDFVDDKMLRSDVLNLACAAIEAARHE